MGFFPPFQTLAAGLGTRSLLLRLGFIAVLLGGLAVLFAFVAGWLPPKPVTRATVVHAFESLDGRHEGFRRNHAKGLDFTGYFESTGDGAALSKASLFAPGRVPVVGRFSLAGGRPFAADADRAVRGLAVRFQLGGGQEWRTATINLPVFPVRDGKAFYERLVASTPDPATGKPDPAKMKAFLEKHPESAKAGALLGAAVPSSGFANTRFNALNAFRFVNAAGETAYVRWSFLPLEEEPEPSAPPQDPAAAPGDNRLFDGLIGAVRQHPLRWRLVAIVAAPGDPTDDATLPWPAERRQVELGTLVVEAVQSDDVGPARDLTFDPLVLPDGIAPSDDPLLSARSAVYAGSFIHREGEAKHPGAIPPSEVAK